MFAPLFLGALGYRLLTFPETPPSNLLAAGRLVYQNGAGPDRTLLDDKVVLGTWFDGRLRRPVDTVVLVGPAVVARWLGYLAEQEGWPESTLQSRWQLASARLNHTVTFVVRLAAFPRLDPLEFGVWSEPKPATMANPKFKLEFHRPMSAKDPLYTADGDRFLLGARPSEAVHFEKYEPGPISDRPFYSLTSLSALFLADGERDEPDDGIPLGDYYGAAYVVSFPVSQAMYRAKDLTLTVQLTSKRETAHFVMQPFPHKVSRASIDETNTP